MSAYLAGAAPLVIGCAILAAFVFGVLIGCIGSAFLRREELRTAQRGVDEARAALTSAGLGHLASVPAPRPAAPALAEGR